MIGFEEAFIYGKWLFGKKFKRATETSDGWLSFLDKDDKSLGEEQTWDEFEWEWKRLMEKNDGFRKFVESERKSKALKCKR